MQMLFLERWKKALVFARSTEKNSNCKNGFKWEWKDGRNSSGGAEKWLIDFQIVTLYNVGQTERDVFS